MSSIFNKKEKEGFSGFNINKQNVSGNLLKKDINYILKHLNDNSIYDIKIDLKFRSVYKK